MQKRYNQTELEAERKAQLEKSKRQQRDAIAHQTLDGIISAIEAHELFGKPQSTIRKACADGKLPARKTGRDWIMRRVDAAALWGDSKSEQS